MAKILIIDDRLVNRQFLTTLLGYQHHELREASDGAEGLRIAREQRPDLIISDVLMPTMDGYEFVRRLREDPEIGKTPVVFSTAHYLNRESRALAEKCGITSIIYKPCESQVVLDLVANALAGPVEIEPPPLEPEEFDREHQKLLTNKLAEKTEQLRDAHGKLTALIELSTDLASERDPVELLDRYCSVAREVIGARWTLVAFLGGNRTAVQHLGAVGLELEDSPELRSGLLATGIFKTVISEGRIICLSDVTSTPGALHLPKPLPRAASLLVAPLSMRGRIYGWLCLADKLGIDAFSEQDEHLAAALAAKMAVAYDNARLYSESMKYADKLVLEMSERVRVERELNESRSRLAGIIDSAMDSIITVDSDQRLVLFNKAAERMFGCLAAQVIGQPLDRFIPPRFRSSHAQDIRKFGETGVTTRTMAAARAISGVRADGEEFPAEASISQIEVGSQKLYTVIMRDITEKNRAQERLQASELRYRRLFESAKDGILVLDAVSGQIVDVNPFLLELLGYSKEELLGRELWEIGSFKDIVASRDAFDQLQEQGFIRYENIPLETKGGIVKEVEFVSNSYIAGRIRVIQCNIRDISERKRAEEALRESEEKFRALADHSIQGIVLVQEGRTTFVNPACCEITGFSVDESLAQTTAQRLELVHPDDRDRAIDRQRRFERGEPIDEVDELRIRRKDGEVRWVLASNKSFTLQRKPVSLGIIVDITELKQAEEALRSKNEELTAMTQQLWQTSKLATMGELAASIAHELNNPLATVGLRTENLLMQMPADSDQRRPLEIIAQEVDRMANLVNNLLQFSRRSHRQVSTVALDEEIATSVDFVHYHLRSHRIDVVREFGPDLPSIQADRQQLRQLFLNLLTNASDAMPGGGTLTVRATRSTLDGAEAVAVEFADTGEGISEENLARIWEPFFTTKPEGKGTGLGLAICRRIAEEHGGEIQIESRNGNGATVRVLFPATADAPALREL